MAFDFIKKVFSFGGRPAEAEAPAEPQPRKDAASGQLVRKLEERPPSAGIEAAPEPGPPAELPGTPLESPAMLPEVPVEPPAEVPPAEPFAPAAAPEIPATPVEVPPPPAEPRPAPIGIPPAQPPAAPEVPDSEPEELPAENPGGATPPEANQASEGVLPDAEVLSPLRQPLPVFADPIAREIAPEPEVVAPPAPPAASPPVALAPSTARQKFGEQVSVGKSVGRREQAAGAATAVQPRGWLQRMRAGLSRSSQELSENLSGVFTKGQLTEDFAEELEEVLIRSDLGADTAMRVTDALMAGRYGFRTTESQVRAVMADEIAKVLVPVAKTLELDLRKAPHVVLVVGVNGTGKTTTIGKLAAKLTEGGLSVMLAAGDTFRAAAIEQLKIWGERTRSPVVSSKLGADAAGLAYDAFEKAKAAGADVLIIDTAGRLQNRAELMAELEKIVRVLKKLDPEAPHTVLQTLDATTGQNALNQVEIFKNVAGVSGLVMTKLDGTARGGILVAIAAKHKLPVYFIGVGEGVDDLEPFSARDFAQTIAGTTYG